MHINSIKAYNEERAKLSARAESIYTFLYKAGDAFTDRQVKNAMFPYGDVNMVQPRITEMIKAGIVQEIGKTKCTLTNKTVRLVKALLPSEIQEEPQQQLL